MDRGGSLAFRVMNFKISMHNANVEDKSDQESHESPKHRIKDGYLSNACTMSAGLSLKLAASTL